VWVGDLNYRVALPGGNRGDGAAGDENLLSDGEGGEGGVTVSVQCKVCMAVGGCDHVDANGEEVFQVAKSTSEVAMEKYMAWQEAQNGGGGKDEAAKEGKEGKEGTEGKEGKEGSDRSVKTKKEDKMGNEEDFNTVVDMCAKGLYSELVVNDQLLKEMDRERAFAAFHEAPIVFAPTYRMERGLYEVSMVYGGVWCMVCGVWCVVCAIANLLNVAFFSSLLSSLSSLLSPLSSLLSLSLAYKTYNNKKFQNPSYTDRILWWSPMEDNSKGK
jgi:hypothetical protein